MALEFKILHSLEETITMREVWTRLARHPFADLDYYMMILGLRSEVIQPYVVLVLRNGEPITMAVCRIEHGGIDLKLGYWHLCRLPLRTLGVLYDGIVGEQTSETAEAVLTGLNLALKQRLADAVLLSYARKSSEVCKLAQKQAGFFCRDHVVRLQPHWKLSLEGGMEKINMGLSRNLRQQLRRKAKNLHERFPKAIKIRCFRYPEELEQMSRDVVSIARKTYQWGLGVGFLDNQETQARIAFEAHRRWLRIYVLYIAGQPCAYWWGIVFDNTFHSCALGFDPVYGEHSPGTYLLAKTLEDLCAEGIEYVDYGIGEARYKQQFGSEQWLEGSVFLFAPTLRAVTLNMARTVNESLIAFIRQILQRFKIMETVKRFWRRRLAS
jgi:hypothetical protein